MEKKIKIHPLNALSDRELLLMTIKGLSKLHDDIKKLIKEKNDK